MQQTTCGHNINSDWLNYVHFMFYRHTSGMLCTGVCVWLVNIALCEYVCFTACQHHFVGCKLLDNCPSLLRYSNWINQNCYFCVSSKSLNCLQTLDAVCVLCELCMNISMHIRVMYREWRCDTVFFFLYEESRMIYCCINKSTCSEEIVNNKIVYYKALRMFWFTSMSTVESTKDFFAVIVSTL